MTHLVPSRRCLLSLALGLFVGSLAGCASPVATPSKALRVGCDFDNEPFASIGANGEPVGRDVEMMIEIGKALGQEIQFVRIPFNDLLPALERGEIDAVCATLGITAERSKRVAFSQPYFSTRISVLVRADGPKALSELAGKRVSASPATTSEYALRAGLPDSIAVLDNPDKKKADQRVLSGDVAGAVIDGPDADDFARASNGQLAVIAEPLAVEQYAIAMRLDDVALHTRIAAALETLIPVGKLAELDRLHGLRADSSATR